MALDPKQVAKVVQVNPYGLYGDFALQVIRNGNPSENTKDLDAAQVWKKVYNATEGKVRVTYVS